MHRLMRMTRGFFDYTLGAAIVMVHLMLAARLARQPLGQ